MSRKTINGHESSLLCYFGSMQEKAKDHLNLLEGKDVSHFVKTVCKVLTKTELSSDKEVLDMVEYLKEWAIARRKMTQDILEANMCKCKNCGT